MCEGTIIGHPPHVCHSCCGGVTWHLPRRVRPCAPPRPSYTAYLRCAHVRIIGVSCIWRYGQGCCCKLVMFFRLCSRARPPAASSWLGRPSRGRGAPACSGEGGGRENYVAKWQMADILQKGRARASTVLRIASHMLLVPYSRLGWWCGHSGIVCRDAVAVRGTRETRNARELPNISAIYCVTGTSHNAELY